MPASVSKTCLVGSTIRRIRKGPGGAFPRRTRYSVDARAVGRPVEIRAYAERVELWQDGKIGGEHTRAFGRGKAIYDPLHYIPALRRVRRKLGRVPNGDRQPLGECSIRLPASGWSISWVRF